MIKKSTPSRFPIRVDPKFEHSYFIELFVKPNARKNQIIEDYGDLLVTITDPPEKGKANKAIIKFLSKRLRISSSMINLVQGHTATTKIFRVTLEKSSVDILYKKLVKNLE